MKVCKKCGEAKQAGEFSADRMAKDGLCTWCKVCSKENAKAWRGVNDARRAQYKAAYNAEHVQARKAQKAVERSHLPCVRTQACAHCGAQATDYHHHKGYAQEHWLDVVALCRSCHKQEHIAGRKAQA